MHHDQFTSSFFFLPSKVSFVDIHVFMRLQTGRCDLDRLEHLFYFCTIQASWSAFATKVSFPRARLWGGEQWGGRERGEAVPSEMHRTAGIVADAAQQISSILAIVGMFLKHTWSKNNEPLWRPAASVWHPAPASRICSKSMNWFRRAFLLASKMDGAARMSQFYWKMSKKALCVCWQGRCWPAWYIQKREQGLKLWGIKFRHSAAWRG